MEVRHLVHGFLVIDEQNACGCGSRHCLISQVRRMAARSGRVWCRSVGRCSLPQFLFMAIFSEPLFALVGGNLPAFSFFAARHVLHLLPACR